MPALVTPFAADGDLDIDAHRRNVKTLSARGVDGFVVGGSTGQGPYLEPGERATLVGVARDALGPEPFLVCGVFAETIRTATRQVGEAANTGADAALVATPTALIRGRDGLVAGFFRDLAAITPIPILLYSVPAVTGYSLPTDVVSDLARVAGIVGIKDSGGDPSRVEALNPLIESGFLVFAGTSRAVYASRARGAYGAITASSNYASTLVTAALDDDGAQAELTTLAAVVESYGLAGTYAAAARRGLATGFPRAPLHPVDPAGAAEVAAALTAAGSVEA
jgi:dihydrodipicolinate synthase/N-acetylneuraminate lyase